VSYIPHPSNMLILFTKLILSSVSKLRANAHMTGVSALLAHVDIKNDALMDRKHALRLGIGSIDHKIGDPRPRPHPRFMTVNTAQSPLLCEP
jgi:hypothetical protein